MVAAVLTGQLSIGWSNDLLDLERDRAVARTDKPLAAPDVDLAPVRVACVAALVATVVTSLALGWVPGLLQLLVVASGWAYNLGLKATVASFVPYALAFGALPAVVWSAGPEPVPGWLLPAGALLGVAAHLLNVLPDLADDAATGVRGLPHRLGARGSRVLAAGLLTAATVTLVASTDLGVPVRAAVLALAGALAAVAVMAGGRRAFRAAVGLALVDVVVLVVAR